MASQAFDFPIAQVVGLPSGSATPEAVIRWGDGHVDRVEATPLAGAPGDFVAWTAHTYNRGGTFNARVAFRENGKVVGQTHARLKVQKPPYNPPTPPTPIPTEDMQVGLTLPAVTGTPFNGVLGTLTFPKPPTTDEVQYADVRIEWGDGTMSHGQLTASGDDQFQVSGAHTYATPGNYSVHVSAGYTCDPLMPIPGQPELELAYYPGTGADMISTLEVSGPTVVLPAPSVQIAGASFAASSSNSFTGTLATMTGISPDPLGADVYAAINWGDATPPLNSFDVVVRFENGQYVVSASHVYFPSADHPAGVPATYQVTITLLLNDHVNLAGNTVLGSVTDQLTVTPVPIDLTMPVGDGGQGVTPLAV